MYHSPRVNRKIIKLLHLNIVVNIFSQGICVNMCFKCQKQLLKVSKIRLKFVNYPIIYTYGRWFDLIPPEIFHFNVPISLHLQEL